MSKVTENRHIIYDGVINKNLKYYLLYMIIVFVDVLRMRLASLKNG